MKGNFENIKEYGTGIKVAKKHLKVSNIRFLSMILKRSKFKLLNFMFLV
ncbi:MAG: hypothetical protein ACI9XO_004837 [Paraglaciecola sp.]|jgi:hypothetical protein